LDLPKLETKLKTWISDSSVKGSWLVLDHALR